MRRHEHVAPGAELRGDPRVPERQDPRQSALERFRCGQLRRWNRGVAAIEPRIVSIRDEAPIDYRCGVAHGTDDAFTANERDRLGQYAQGPRETARPFDIERERELVVDDSSASTTRLNCGPKSTGRSSPLGWRHYRDRVCTVYTMRVIANCARLTTGRASRRDVDTDRYRPTISNNHHSIAVQCSAGVVAVAALERNAGAPPRHACRPKRA